MSTDYHTRPLSDGIGTDEAAMGFLAELAEHATDQRFVYRHAYDKHDVVIWDNSQLLHCAERLDRSRSPEQDRILHRVSVHGWPQITV